MKRPPSKAQIRHEIEDQVEEFLKKGGEVKAVNTGASGLINGELSTTSLGFEQPRQERTPVQHVVAAIELRRQSKLAKNQPKRTKKRSPRKKVIYDDFGEPIRVIWLDE